MNVPIIRQEIISGHAAELVANKGNVHQGLISLTHWNLNKKPQYFAENSFNCILLN